MNDIITTGKAFLVGRQFHQNKERFTSLQDAMDYANRLAVKTADEIVEVFVCCNNIKANIPVVEVVETVVHQERE